MKIIKKKIQKDFPSKMPSEVPGSPYSCILIYEFFRPYQWIQTTGRLLRFTFMKRTFDERETEQTSRRFFKRVPIRQTMDSYPMGKTT